MRDDQAAGLRRLFAANSARVLLVADAAWPQRGWIALNLAAALSRAGEQVVMLDSERESVAALWGARCRYELVHVLAGDRRLVDAVVPGPESSVILPMRRAAANLAAQERTGQRSLARALDTFVEHNGLLVVPVSPGGLRSALWRFGAGELLLSIGEGSAATTAAYASIKSLLARRPQPSLRLSFACADPSVARQTRFAHLQGVVTRFIGAPLHFAGALPAGELARGVAGRTFFDDVPAAARAIEEIAQAATAWRLPRLEFSPRAAARQFGQVVTI